MYVFGKHEMLTLRHVMLHEGGKQALVKYVVCIHKNLQIRARDNPLSNALSNSITSTAFT